MGGYKYARNQSITQENNQSTKIDLTQFDEPTNLA